MPEFNQTLISGLLSPFAPQAEADKAAAWIVKSAEGFLDGRGRPDPICAALREVRGLQRPDDLADKRATGEALYARYCHYHAVPYQRDADTLRHAMQVLADRYRYEDEDALREHQPDLHAIFWGGLMEHTWHGHYLRRQPLEEAEVARAANTWHKRWMETADPKWGELLESRKRAQTLACYARYERGELYAAVQGWLRDHQEYAHTYNDVARGIGISPGSVREIMEVKDVLVALSSTAQNTYRDVVSYVVKAAKGGGKTVFRMAPFRREYQAAPTRENKERLVRECVLRLLLEKPHQTSRALREQCRAAFIRLQSADVDRALSMLAAHGDVVTEPGERRAKLHSVAPHVRAVIEADPGSLLRIAEKGSVPAPLVDVEPEPAQAVTPREDAEEGEAVGQRQCATPTEDEEDETLPTW